MKLAWGSGWIATVILAITGCSAGSGGEVDEAAGESESAATSCVDLSGTFEVPATCEPVRVAGAVGEALEGGPYYAKQLVPEVVPGKRLTIRQTACDRVLLSYEAPVYRSGMEISDCGTYGGCAPGWDKPVRFEARTQELVVGLVRRQEAYSQSGFVETKVSLDSAGFSRAESYPGISSKYGQRRSPEVNPFGGIDSITYQKTSTGLAYTSTRGPNVRWSGGEGRPRIQTSTCVLQAR